MSAVDSGVFNSKLSSKGRRRSYALLKQFLFLQIINAVSVAPATPATNQRNRVMSEPRPNEITDGESESGDDDEEGEEEEENDVFDPRSKSMVSTIHKRSKKQMAYKDVQNMPKSARKPGPAKKGRRPVTASAVGNYNKLLLKLLFLHVFSVCSLPRSN